MVLLQKKTNKWKKGEKVLNKDRKEKKWVGKRKKKVMDMSSTWKDENEKKTKNDKTMVNSKRKTNQNKNLNSIKKGGVTEKRIENKKAWRHHAW